MKLAKVLIKENGRTNAFRALTPNSESVGIVYENEFYPTESSLSFVEVINSWGKVTSEVKERKISGVGTKFGLKDIKLMAPFAGPSSTIFCVGKNYLEHVNEVDTSAHMKTISKPTAPKHPIIFSKAWTSVIGPGEPVRYPTGISNELDYEGELGVVIGKAGRGISEATAYDHVFGFTIVNDITARDLQRTHQQWFLGKSLDTFCPLGPWIVPKEELLGRDNTLSLDIQTRINGEVRQNGNTRNLLFSIPKLIATISAGITLKPGDILATGTPRGVGAGFNPPKFLKPPDIMVVEIEGIGNLVNAVV
eukprot:CAMPEP_0204831224 /NCGR_PEP_ID=MMETSP1346-20131115/10149_1 /ASSEMBLY_ACC=CAM_ASM_000771 /TAXON_ID=215587 /ORGANISM="Aplanochytrium stocchinoi, Strain GSBS06" /LENGTH=306 /DNA_ID=CAMNT_0051962075 /DNA_START=339 /DNA_END=1259 /DNA_ORIENTATION=+